MTDNREKLEAQLEQYETQLRRLHAYVKELNDRTAEHNTEREHFEADLVEAEHNVKYYEGEITRIKELIETEPESTTYFVYEDAVEKWRWQLRAANNRIIADSGEGYHNKQDCLRGIALVKASQDAPVKDRPVKEKS